MASQGTHPFLPLCWLYVTDYSAPTPLLIPTQPLKAIGMRGPFHATYIKATVLVILFPTLLWTLSLSAMGESHCCCRCISFFFLLGLSAIFSWIALRPNGPTISVTAIYMPALNRTSRDHRRSTTIAVDIRLVNPNKDSGIHYDGLNVSLYFKDSGKLVGGAPIPNFYQGRQKKAQKQAVFNGTGEGWEAVFREGSNGTLVFRVVLETLVRYKVVLWNTGRHAGEYVGEVPVGVGGANEGNEATKLK